RLRRVLVGVDPLAVVTGLRRTERVRRPDAAVVARRRERDVRERQAGAVDLRARAGGDVAVAAADDRRAADSARLGRMRPRLAVVVRVPEEVATGVLARGERARV